MGSAVVFVVLSRIQEIKYKGSESWKRQEKLAVNTEQKILAENNSTLNNNNNNIFHIY
jgi:hypothetical protein